MSLSIIFPKVGNTQEECEDYLAIDESRMRYVIADGASDSIFSSLWAKCLVDTFLDMEDLSGDPEKLMDKLCRSSINLWHDKIEWDNLKWNVKNKSVKGSYSTFIGVEVRKTDRNFRVNCLAVGDSCVFIKTGKRLESFPVKDLTGFGLHPDLIWSGHGEPIYEGTPLELPDYEMKKYSVEPGTRIIMASDAASKWIMEGGSERIDQLFSNFPLEKEYWDNLRTNGEMKNDDVAVIAVQL
ncbi:MAG: PP2C family serine/threonine-protein phosphatase [Thermoplasmataceae archaeon]